MCRHRREPWSSFGWRRSQALSREHINSGLARIESALGSSPTSRDILDWVGQKEKHRIWLETWGAVRGWTWCGNVPPCVYCRQRRIAWTSHHPNALDLSTSSMSCQRARRPSSLIRGREVGYHRWIRVNVGFLGSVASFHSCLESIFDLMVFAEYFAIEIRIYRSIDNFIPDTI